jgi:Uma2 family endonuclease
MDMITPATPTKTLLTGDDLLLIEVQQPGKLFELIEGELKEYPVPGLKHNKIETLFAFFLTLYQREKNSGTVFTGETGFYTRGNSNTVRFADLAFISYTRMPVGKVPDGFSYIVPELVVEIISPSNSADEMDEKIQEWLNFGVLLVWVAYPKTRRVHVYTHTGQITILNADDTLTGGDVLPEFSVPVREFFGE